MHREIAIRKAEPADAPAIASILENTGWFPFFNGDTLKQNARRIGEFLDNAYAEAKSHSAYVAETGEDILAGYVTVHWLPYLFLPAPEGYISEIFVDERYRGEGIGKALLEAVRVEADAKGCSRLMLCNSRTRHSYKREFYQKLGWQERETVANFILKL